jgi:hypothetical protein
MFSATSSTLWRVNYFTHHKHHTYDTEPQHAKPETLILVDESNVCTQIVDIITMGYAKANDATKNECYNEHFCN